jgi:hypothetical protein
VNFLSAPLLWFAAGGLIPVIIHLLYRQRYRRIRWAAMDFLLRALRKTQRRIRLENLILLLVRVLLMVILALAIAKPTLRSEALVGDVMTHTILVIDNSYSTAYQTGQTSVLRRAKDFAKQEIIDKTLRQFTQADRISVVTLSDFPLQPMPGGSNDKQKIKEAIDAIELSDYGTSMLQTARLLGKVLEDPQWKLHRKMVYLITDMQRTAWLSPSAQERTELAELLKRLSRLPHTQFHLADVGAERPQNAATVSLRLRDRVALAGQPLHFVAEVHNFTAEDLANVGVTLWAGSGAGPMEEKGTQNVFVAADSKLAVHFRHTFIEPGPARLKVELQTDALHTPRGVDDARFLALSIHEALRVLLVDGEPGEGGAKKDETYYLNTALSSWRSGQVFRVTTLLDTFFDATELDGYDLVVLANVPALRPEVVQRLEKFVGAGGGLLIALGENADPSATNAVLWKEGAGLLPAKLGAAEGVPGTGPSATQFRIGALDTGHPVFENYSETMLTALHDPYMAVNRFVHVEGADPKSILIRLDDPAGSPLLLEKRFGDERRAGRVMLYTSSLDHDWTAGNPGSPIWPILMLDIALVLASPPGTELNLAIGETIALRLPARLYGEFTLALPDERLEEPSRSDMRPGESGFWIYYPRQPEAAPAPPAPSAPAENEGLKLAGFYLLTRQGKSEAGGPRAEPVAAFAVNVPPRQPTREAILHSESNLERIAYEADAPAPLKDFPDFAARVISQKDSGTQQVSVQHQESGFWRHLAFALLGLLALESLLALLFGLRKR